MSLLCGRCLGLLVVNRSLLDYPLYTLNFSILTLLLFGRWTLSFPLRRIRKFHFASARGKVVFQTDGGTVRGHAFTHCALVATCVVCGRCRDVPPSPARRRNGLFYVVKTVRTTQTALNPMSLYLPDVHNFTLQRYNLFFNSDSYTSNFVSFFLRTTFFVRCAHVKGCALRAAREGFAALTLRAARKGFAMLT